MKVSVYLLQETIDMASPLKTSVANIVFERNLAVAQTSEKSATEDKAEPMADFQASIKPDEAPVYPKVIQVWQLQSFQIMKFKFLLWLAYPLYHIQCYLKAYPQTMASIPAGAYIVKTFQAGFHRVLRCSENLVLKASQVLAGIALCMLGLIKSQISVMLEELMFPQPCQLSEGNVANKVQSTNITLRLSPFISFVFITIQYIFRYITHDKKANKRLKNINNDIFIKRRKKCITQQFSKEMKIELVLLVIAIYIYR